MVGWACNRLDGGGICGGGEQNCSNLLLGSWRTIPDYFTTLLDSTLVDLETGQLCRGRAVVV